MDNKMKDTILELAQRCERWAGLTGSEAASLNDAIHCTVPEQKAVQPPDYVRSLDAALTLVPEGWTRFVRWSPENEARAAVYDSRCPDWTVYEAPGKTEALALCAATLRARGGGGVMGTEPPFQLRDRVRKVRGYQWPGVVVSVFKNLAGQTRVVVECTIEEVSGALHIYSPEQLERVDD